MSDDLQGKLDVITSHLADVTANNSELNVKLDGAKRELDKITNQLFEERDANAELQNNLAERKHSEQLAGWAIDRALESKKIAGVGGFTAQEVCIDAQTLCDWIVGNSAKPKETMQ